MKKLNFESWYSNILEAVNTKEPVAVTIDTETKGAKGPEVETDSTSPSFSREEIISDIDTIMTHLSQLGTQVREELENDDVFDVNEAGEETAMAKVKDFLFAPKYRSMQKKVNKMKMNALDIQITVDNLSGAKDSPEAAKKQTLKDKKTTIDAQIASLQTAVDDKAKDRGSYVQKVLKSEKIKGQMALVKRASGQEDDPAKKKDLAASMAELQKRFEEEQAAAAALKDKAKEEPKAEEPKREEPKVEEPKVEEPKKEEPKVEEPKKEEPKVEEPKKEEPKKEEPKKEEPAKEKPTDGADDATKADREKKNSKEGMLDRYKELLKKAEESGDEEKIKSIKDKIAAVSAKESWQLEGTELGRIFEAELKLLESQYKLNESRYNNLSVADKFRQLLS